MGFVRRLSRWQRLQTGLTRCPATLELYVREGISQGKNVTSESAKMKLTVFSVLLHTKLASGCTLSRCAFR
jgi:hypothetical protein